MTTLSSAATDREGLQALIAAIRARGYEVLGPHADGEAIGLAPLESVQDLPQGVTAQQAPGRYRLQERQDEALFGWAVGPATVKRFLYPPEMALFRSRLSDDGLLQIEPASPEMDDEPPLAFVGIRPCDAAAVAVQDRVLLQGEFADPLYASRRQRALLVVAECGDPAPTCFCASMGSGPGIGDQPHDLALTEVPGSSGTQPTYVLRAGSETGAQLLQEAGLEAASDTDQAAAARVVDGARERMGRALAPAVRERLAAARENDRWQQVAERCLACANCTLVCPTCFCHTVEDSTDLEGGAARTRRWDSCFHIDFSYIHGGSVRTGAAPRYRQWLLHKLSTWHDQFGQSGCVGCGRCIVWCPVGIDITEEATALAAAAGGRT